MERMTNIKGSVLVIFGTMGGILTSSFGGWDAALQTLVIFMTVDYITGLIVAAVFQKSGKSENGALDSRAGFKGLCKKGMMLLMVLIAVRLDIMTSTEYLRDASIIAFVVNETISIVENAGLMGVPIPSVINKAIDLLKNKEGEPR